MQTMFEVQLTNNAGSFGILADNGSRVREALSGVEHLVTALVPTAKSAYPNPDTHLVFPRDSARLEAVVAALSTERYLWWQADGMGEALTWANDLFEKGCSIQKIEKHDDSDLVDVVFGLSPQKAFELIPGFSPKTWLEEDLSKIG